MFNSKLIKSLILGSLSLSSMTAVAQQCQPGSYNNAGTCTTCAAGTYSTTADATSCTRAQRGYFVQAAGSTSQTPCPRGSYSDTRAATTCTACPAGYFNNVQRATACCSCCSGYFSAGTGNTACNACPAARPYSDPGTTMRSTCSNAMGMYAPVASCSMNGRFCPATFSDAPTAAVRRRHLTQCGPGETLCPISETESKCVSTDSELWSCGGCNSFGLGVPNDGPVGMDCSAIPYVDRVGCKNGRCVIDSCMIGFVPSGNGTACISQSNSAHDCSGPSCQDPLIYE